MGSWLHRLEAAWPRLAVVFATSRVRPFPPARDDPVSGSGFALSFARGILPTNVGTALIAAAIDAKRAMGAAGLHPFGACVHRPARFAERVFHVY